MFWLTPDPPARIWLSLMVIAARTIASSSSGPTAAQWLRSSLSPWTVPVFPVTFTLRLAPTPVLAPYTSPPARAASSPRWAAFTRRRDSSPTTGAVDARLSSCLIVRAAPSRTVAAGMACNSGTGRRAARIDGDVFDAAVFGHTQRAAFGSEAGLLEAGHRQVRPVQQMVVDPDGTGVELVGHSHGAADIAGEHRGCQAVVGVVGELKRFLFVGEALDGEDRPENFFPDQRVVLRDAGDDGRS